MGWLKGIMNPDTVPAGGAASGTVPGARLAEARCAEGGGRMPGVGADRQPSV